MATGLLADDDQKWELTAAGRTTARQRTVNPLQVGKFVRDHAHLRGNGLILEQYRRHPYYATRSELLGKLRLEPEALARIAAAKPKVGLPGLVTIGYEVHSLEAYLNALLRDGVTTLCDVRRNPLSRKYGFSKGALCKAGLSVGIRYEHLPELGIASDERRNLETQADYDALFDHYEKNRLPQQSCALQVIRDWIEEGSRVALTCYEAKACQCHRHCVSEALEQMLGAGFSTQHL